MSTKEELGYRKLEQPPAAQAASTAIIEELKIGNAQRVTALQFMQFWHNVGVIVLILFGIAIAAGFVIGVMKANHVGEAPTETIRYH